MRAPVEVYDVYNDTSVGVSLYIGHNPTLTLTLNHFNSKHTNYSKTLNKIPHNCQFSLGINCDSAAMTCFESQYSDSIK